MKYFAMIEGEQRGPFELHDLPAAGVRPDTYVWCKGMPDWCRAREIADISRFYRQRISDLMHPSPLPAKTEAPDSERFQETSMPRFDRYIQQSGNIDINNVQEPDYTQQPRSMLVESLVLTVFCFPLTGFIAIYYSLLSRREWNKGNGKEAHEYSGRAKMWVGITFFLGIMLYALIGRQVGK